MDATTITFYCDLPLEEFENLTNYVIKYQETADDKYIIAHEISLVKQKSHFHVISEKFDWNKFRDNVLIKKYGLKSKNKQFGKVKKINDINKMISYVLKEKDPVKRKTNMSADIIEEYLANSFKKEDDRTHIEICIDKLAPLPYLYEFSDTDLICKKIQILDYFKQNNLDCNFNKVQRVFDMYLMRQTQLSSNSIYEIMRQVRNNRL